MGYSLIVKSDGGALKVSLPEIVIDKIKEVWEYGAVKPQVNETEEVLRTFLKSLDTFLFCFDHIKTF